MMARTLLNLDTTEQDGYSFLLHSGRGVGKTHLMGDMLKEESKAGDVWFLNIAGEDGQMTLKGMGLGKMGETVETIADLDAALADCQKRKLQGLGLDSLNALVRPICITLFGSDRMPTIKKGSERNEWSEFHRESERLWLAIRRSARFVVVTCPSDRSLEQLSQTTLITPNLPGRQAGEVAGYFDFAGYLVATAKGSGRVDRVLRMTPDSSTIVKGRTPKQLGDIALPEGPGGWAKIKATIQASYA